MRNRKVSFLQMRHLVQCLAHIKCPLMRAIVTIIIGSVSFSKLLNLSEPQFLHLKTGLMTFITPDCCDVWRKQLDIIFISTSNFVVVVHCSALSDSLGFHGLQPTRLPSPSPSPGACSNSCPLSWWCPPIILFSAVPSPPAFNLSQRHGLFQWVSCSHQVAKVLELQHQSFQWVFRVDFL